MHEDAFPCSPCDELTSFRRVRGSTLLPSRLARPLDIAFNGLAIPPDVLDFTTRPVQYAA